MPRAFLTAVAVLCLGMAAPVPAEAKDTRSAHQQTTPPKDCTKFNGRHGYYGNPWCTPAEQDRWDRWEARRLQTR